MADYKIKTILAIDDEKNLLEVWKGLFEARGYRVLTASNGAEGLRILEQHVPDLIVLDVMMPEMTGLQFCNELCQRYKVSRTKELPFKILVLTARNDLENIFIEIEVHGFLTKPVSLETLLYEVKVIMGDDKPSSLAASKVNEDPVALIVDADYGKYQALSELFNKNNIRTLHAATGIDGITKAKELLPDVILLNMKLGDVSGDMVAYNLRRMPITKAIPFLVYTHEVIVGDRVILNRIVSHLSINCIYDGVTDNDLLHETKQALSKLTKRL